VTRPPLQLVDGEADRIPSAEQVAASQVAGAQKLLTRDLSQAPRWSWSHLNLLVGPMLPGDLVIVGALRNNGKSMFLMSQMEALAAAGQPTLYFPLEIDPEVCRLQWAAWKLNLDRTPVQRQEWDALPHGAERAVHDILEEQKSSPLIHFATPKSVNLKTMRQWFEWARREFDARVVMIDHLHRFEAEPAADQRVSMTKAIRRIKDMAREFGIVIIAAAQLNRSSDPIDAYTAPVLSRLKETSAIEEEADVVLMLSRKLRRDLPDGWQHDLKLGRLTEKDLAEDNVMVVTCRKHRLDNDAINARVLLAVENRRIARSFA
jgi:replicative DNA helicase